MSSLATNGSIPVDGKYAVAKLIADAHRAMEPRIAEIFRIQAPGIESNPSEPIKLLEVNPNTPASGIVPVGLPSHPESGIVYSSIIVEIHPSELPQLRGGQLTLPNGWILDDSQNL